MQAAEEIAIDETNFPDENFRNYVLTNCDTDNNRALSEEEIKGRTKINVQEKEITSVLYH